MTNKEKFKEFAKQNPEFAYAVKNGKTTWQELFEIYDMYGEDTNLWNNYKKTSKVENLTNSIGIKDIVNGLKGINIDTLQENLESLGKAVGFIEELTNVVRKKDDATTKTKKSKGVEPINRFFDD